MNGYYRGGIYGTAEVLSAPQAEALLEALDRFELPDGSPRLLPTGARAGYLLGDGTGVGKGRTVAGIFQELFQRGLNRSGRPSLRKMVWVSVSQDLIHDAMRDLADVGFQVGCRTSCPRLGYQPRRWVRTKTRSCSVLRR